MWLKARLSGWKGRVMPLPGSEWWPSRLRLLSVTLLPSCSSSVYSSQCLMKSAPVCSRACLLCGEGGYRPSSGTLKISKVLRRFCLRSDLLPLISTEEEESNYRMQDIWWSQNSPSTECPLDSTAAGGRVLLAHEDAKGLLHKIKANT